MLQPGERRIGRLRLASRGDDRGFRNHVVGDGARVSRRAPPGPISGGGARFVRLECLAALPQDSLEAEGLFRRRALRAAAKRPFAIRGRWPVSVGWDKVAPIMVGGGQTGQPSILDQCGNTGKPRPPAHQYVGDQAALGARRPILLPAFRLPPSLPGRLYANMLSPAPTFHHRAKKP